MACVRLLGGQTQATRCGSHGTLILRGPVQPAPFPRPRRWTNMPSRRHMGSLMVRRPVQPEPSLDTLVGDRSEQHAVPSAVDVIS
jgi:hypothetical protein